MAGSSTGSTPGPDTVVAPDLEAFLAACERHGVEAVALQAVREIRPVTHPDGAVVVGLQRWTTAVGYRAGVVVRLRLEDPPDDLADVLRARGYQVRVVSDNVT